MDIRTASVCPDCLIGSSGGSDESMQKVLRNPSGCCLRPVKLVLSDSCPHFGKCMTVSTMNNDSSHLHSVHREPGIAPSTLHTVIHLTPLTALHSGYYNYPHFADEEKEAQSNLFSFTQPGPQNTALGMGAPCTHASCIREALRPCS